MGWTKRSEIKTDFQDILAYIESIYSFHDYRIGHIHYEGSTARITIEEVIYGERLAKSTGLVWDFSFDGVRDFQIHVDAVMGFWIHEVVRGNEDGKLVFSLDQGYIEVFADAIKLGIPSPEHTE